MSPEAQLRRPHQPIPALVLVAIVAVGLASGYYFAGNNFASASSPPVVTWSISPLKMGIPSSGVGSAPDSFTCSPGVAPVFLSATSSQPSIVQITVSPTAFSSCGGTADNVIVYATCASGVTVTQCAAVSNPAGIITVCGPSSYTCLKKPLQVVVAPG